MLSFKFKPNTSKTNFFSQQPFNSRRTIRPIFDTIVSLTELLEQFVCKKVSTDFRFLPNRRIGVDFRSFSKYCFSCLYVDPKKRSVVWTLKLGTVQIFS